MKPMRYKGYSARIEYSDEDGCFVGARGRCPRPAYVPRRER